MGGVAVFPTEVNVYKNLDGKEAQYASIYKSAAVFEQLRAQTADVRYRLSADTEVTAQDTIAATDAPWKFYLAPDGPVVPGSVVLDVDGALFFDDGEGQIVRNYSTATGTGTAVGTINYNTTEVDIGDYAGRPVNATITPRAVLIGDDWSVVQDTTFRTVASPLRPNGFTVRADDIDTGAQYNGQADNQGTVTGDGIVGDVNLQQGLATIAFPAPVSAVSVYYNAVAYKQIPLDPDILGLDPVRLPSDGRVPIVRDADILVLTHTQTDLIATPTAGQVVSAGRDKLYSLWIEDDAGTRLNPAQYTVDLEEGTATLADPFTAEDETNSALVGDLHLVHRVDEMALCTEARIDGTLQLAQPLYHALPANDTRVSSAVYLGDLRARVKDWVSYTTDPGYGGTGTETNAQYNLLAYPVAIDNRGAVPERWKIKFNSSTAFELYGENRGLVATGSTAVDFSPTNPQTGTPYFTITADGWGSGWSIGNTTFFETEAAAAPLWMIRTVLPGLATVDDDQLKIELRGDHN